VDTLVNNAGCTTRMRHLKAPAANNAYTA